MASGGKIWRERPRSCRSASTQFRSGSASPTRCPLTLEFAKKNPHEHAVITCATHFFQLRQSLLAGFGRRKRALGSHIHIGVAYGKDAGPEGNLLATQPVRIAAAIE